MAVKHTGRHPNRPTGLTYRTSTKRYVVRREVTYFVEFEVEAHSQLEARKSATPATAVKYEVRHTEGTAERIS